jgi:hypothetical protein
MILLLASFGACALTLLKFTFVLFSDGKQLSVNGLLMITKLVAEKTAEKNYAGDKR